ncbi:tyrosine-type recombinase/integrase [Variovorax robiniae]|uniref:Tyrosine-type recombinase/integrase n=1 Tax=Variovorax robiniae TaxID=1836199 RepID=A0ABU8XIS4_9BURK
MEVSRKRSWSLSSTPEGPLAECIDAFTSRLIDQGYAASSAHLETRLVADFSRWLMVEGVALAEITHDHIDRFLRHRARHKRPRRGDPVALVRLLTLLRERGDVAIPAPTARVDVPPAEQLAGDFAAYLREERALAPSTVRTYLPFVALLLAERFDRGSVNLGDLRAADITGFVQHHAAHLQTRRCKTMTTALRSFLQYARYRGDVTADLTAAIPAVASWSRTSIPRAIAPAHVQQVLASCDLRSVTGRRDRAILLLLARLGLRACEICALTLEDIDWQAGNLRVHGKGGRECQLPLPADAGEAIANYLQHGRPTTVSRSLFLRVHAPIQGLKPPQSIDCIVRTALERAGIDSPRKGAHQFRHALATQMLSQGASLSEIGELLRHRSPQTTTIYAKVDLLALRALARPWPGAAR